MAISPRLTLKRDLFWDDWCSADSDQWACSNKLAKFFKIPKSASHIWFVVKKGRFQDSYRVVFEGPDLILSTVEGKPVDFTLFWPLKSLLLDNSRPVKPFDDDRECYVGVQYET